MFTAEVTVLNTGDEIVVNLSDILEDDEGKFSLTGSDEYLNYESNNWTYRIKSEDVDMYFTLRLYETQQLSDLQ